MECIECIKIHTATIFTYFVNTVLVLRVKQIGKEIFKLANIKYRKMCTNGLLKQSKTIADNE